MDIDIFADFVCPWCYVGKRRLERALAMVATPDRFRLRWRAFRLNPTMPAAGMPRQAYLDAKFGGAARARQVYEMVRRAGSADGIGFAFHRIRRTPDTLPAHRLVRLATGTGKESLLAERLFAGYFTEGLDIGDTAVLTGLAEEVGLDRALAAAWLAGENGAADVLADDAAARRAGLTGVPCFIIGDRYSLPGAQAPEVLARALDLATVSVQLD